MNEIKTGKKIVSEYIKSLGQNTQINQDIVKIIAKLHEGGKLTDKSIANDLEALRKGVLNENSKTNS